MLSCYRVLDLTDEKGFFCGKALGDLGADVIKIERPGGDPARSIGPFYHDIPDPEKSLYWFAFNANKRGITLNIETADGKEIFRELVKKADVVVESFYPGHMDKLGLGYSVLNEINPGIIVTSISGFGQEGPYRDYKAPDIVVRALGGIMYMVGDPDRPPLAPSYPHAYLIGAMHGAMGTMVALNHRALTGHGQQVDAPTQQGLGFVASVEVQAPWLIEGTIPTRLGRKRWPFPLKDGSFYYPPLLWECKDGDIAYSLMLGPLGGVSNIGLVESIREDSIDPGPLGQWDWKTVSWSDVTKEEAEEAFEILGKYFRKHTKAELLEAALEKGFHLGVCLTAGDALKFPHYRERGFWTEVEHPELGTSITYPGGFARFTEADCGIKHRAPLIGEHNDEIYRQEMGMSAVELVTLKQRSVI